MRRCRIMLLTAMLAIAAGGWAQQREHVVQRGEDFTTIARKYAITVDELMAANPGSSACYAGRKLVIPKHGVPVERKPVTPKELDIQLLSDDEQILTKSSATTYQVGEALWRKGKFEGAMVYLYAAANDGEARAYYPLGDCYAQDSAQCYDEAKAIDCYRKAIAEVKDKAQESYWMSCGALARRYHLGTGVDKDLSQAKRLCTEYQRYADVDGKSDADKLMKDIQAEERAIAEKAAAERRAREAEKRALAAAERKAAAEKAAAERRAAAERKAAQQALATTRTQPAQASQPQATASQTNTTSQSNTGRGTQPFTVKVGMMETTYYPQADGSMRAYSKSPCIYCHGTRTCGGCMYASMVQRSVSYVYICPMCGGSRQCMKCRGRGYTESWGYVDRNGVGQVMNDQGQITTTADVQAAKNQRSSSSSSTRSSSSSRSSGTCTRCAGMLYEQKAYTAAAASHSGIRQPYHHTSGSKCPYCNWVSDHYHYPCSHCLGTGRE